MIDYIEIGPTPAAEDCIGVSSTADYLPAMRAECKRFRVALERYFEPVVPFGSWFGVKSNPHDFGTYCEVVVYYDDDTPAAGDKRVCPQVCAIPGKTVAAGGLGYWSPGVPATDEAKIDISPFYIKGGGSICGLAVFHELAREPARIGLARLVSLLADKRLRVHIAVEKPWTAIDEVRRVLQNRRNTGKAVLHVR
mgnify:CR=1 FL=1